MNKKILKPLTVFAISFSALMFSVNQDSQSRMRHSQKPKLIKFMPSISKANATVLSTQSLYDNVKSSINSDLGELVDGVNELLSSASISSCISIPSGDQELKVDGNYSIHSAPVGAHTFPISELSVTLDKKLVYKLGGQSIGVLYLDCDQDVAEVRYLGKNNGDDWDVAVAYADVDSGEHILMAQDYNAGTGYDAADVAIYYLESASSQAVRYMYNPTTNGNELAGFIEASVSGTVTGNVISDVSASIDENTALTNLVRTGFGGNNDLVIAL